MSLRKDLALVADLVPENSRVLDLGCGSGDLLHHLVQERGCRGTGVEIDPGSVLGAIRLGVPVIELDIDRELDGFADSSYDVVVLSRTIQTVRYPDRVLRHMARIADRLIVSVPNFGWYRHRLQLLTGRLPMGKDLPYSWYDSPNLRYTTLHDLQLLFDKVGLVVERSIPLNAAGDPLRLRGSGNLLASSAVYVLRPASD
jgi:methionine biosynthesis protein MetW